MLTLIFYSVDNSRLKIIYLNQFKGEILWARYYFLTAGVWTKTPYRL